MSCYIFSHIYVLRMRETSQGEFDWVISNFMTTARFFQMEVRYLLGEKKFEKKEYDLHFMTNDSGGYFSYFLPL